MGPTFNEIRYSLYNKLKPLYGDDTSLDIQLCGHVINNMRSQLIKDRFKEQGYLEPQFFQTADLPSVCQKLTVAGVWGGRTELVVDVPQLCGALGAAAVRYLGTPDMNFNWRYVALNNVAFVKFERYTGGVPCWTFTGTRMFLRNPPEPGMGGISVVACFDIPYVTLNGKVIQDVNDPLLDFEYPLPNILTNKVELLAYNDLAATYKQLHPEQEKNNAKDDG